MRSYLFTLPCSYCSHFFASWCFLCPPSPPPLSRYANSKSACALGGGLSRYGAHHIARLGLYTPHSQPSKHHQADYHLLLRHTPAATHKHPDRSAIKSSTQTYKNARINIAHRGIKSHTHTMSKSSSRTAPHHKACARARSHSRSLAACSQPRLPRDGKPCTRKCT